MTPVVADYRARNLLILLVSASEAPPVTAEVASLSLVVPAILSRTYRKSSILAWAQKGTKDVQEIECFQAELTFPAFFLGTRARQLPPAHFTFPL
jgi:hypothetical protein